MVFIHIVVVLALVALNGFFVSAEFALVSVRRTRLEQLAQAGDVRARIAQRLVGDIDLIFSATQLGITVASLALGWLGEATLAQLLRPGLAAVVPVAAGPLAHAAAIVLAFSLITFLHMVLGEQVPKILSVHRSEKMALVVARPMLVFLTVFRPVINVFDLAADRLVKQMGYREGKSSLHALHSPEELELMLRVSAGEDLLGEQQRRRLRGVLELKRTRVHEVMTPRRDVASLAANATLEQVLAMVSKYRYDRYPVHEGTPEAVIGVLHTQDLFRALDEILRSPDPARARREFDLRRVLREALFVPETRTLGDLLEDFRRRRAQVALVVDEYGSVQGMVTLADVVEEVTGRVADEHAPVEPRLMVTESGLVVDGKMNLHDLEHEHQIELPRRPGFETVGGFVLSRLGFIPAGGESFLHDGLRFTVLEVEGRRVAKVKIERLEARG